MKKVSITRADKPNLTHLIRSVQRLEGNPDCFGLAYKYCNQQDCAWLEYCQKEALNDHKRNPEI